MLLWLVAWRGQRSCALSCSSMHGQQLCRRLEQDPCIAYDVNVCSSDVFAIIAPQLRILDRCEANMIRLANDDNFMTALNIQISELEFDMYESQKQVNGIVYATTIKFGK